MNSPAFSGVTKTDVGLKLTMLAFRVVLIDGVEDCRFHRWWAPKIAREVDLRQPNLTCTPFRTLPRITALLLVALLLVLARTPLSATLNALLCALILGVLHGVLQGWFKFPMAAWGFYFFAQSFQVWIVVSSSFAYVSRRICTRNRCRPSRCGCCASAR